MKDEITLLGIEFLLQIKFPEFKSHDRVWLNDESWIKSDGIFYLKPISKHPHKNPKDMIHPA